MNSIDYSTQSRNNQSQEILHSGRAKREQVLKALSAKPKPIPIEQWENEHVALVCHALTQFFRRVPAIAHTRRLLETLAGLTRGKDEPLRLSHKELGALAYPELPKEAARTRKLQRHLEDIQAYQQQHKITLLVYVPGFKKGTGKTAE